MITGNPRRVVALIFSLFLGLSSARADVVKIAPITTKGSVMGAGVIGAGAMMQGAAPAVMVSGPGVVAAPLSSIIVPVIVAPASVELAETPAIQGSRQALESVATQISEKAENGSSAKADQALNKLYTNGQDKGASAVSVPDYARAKTDASVEQGPAGFIKNDEGVWVGGRSKDQYLEIRREHDLLSPKMDLSQAMNVMDDSFDEGRVKLAGVEKAAASRQIKAASVHLEDTLTWIDAILKDDEGRAIAEHTHRVYFHPANNSQSEIAEGNRRVDAYLARAAKDFAKGGKAEKDLRIKLDEVILTFDTRGYKEIENHLREKEAQLRRETGGRFTFQYITEPALEVSKMRAEYNRLVIKYKDQTDGLNNIIDGVTYSRYVGLLLELKAHEYSVINGEAVLQAGRDFFEDIPQPDGKIHRRYITEFDGIKRDKNGKIILEESKSARVPLPLAEVVKDKFLYKLDIYKKNQALIEKDLGAPLNVRFMVDVGGLNRQAAKKGLLVWKQESQKLLMEYLTKQAPILSAQYGFPVTFVFLNSHPKEDLMLFYKAETSAEDWERQSGQGGRGGKPHKGSSRRR